MDTTAVAVDLLRKRDAEVERYIREQVAAPIFMRMMVERQQNPLGLEIHTRDLALDEQVPYLADDAAMLLRARLMARVIFTRPIPHPV